MAPSEFAQRYLLKPAHEPDMAVLIERLTGKPSQVKHSQSEVYVSSKTHQAELMFENADRVFERTYTKGSPMLLTCLRMAPGKKPLPPLVDLPVPAAPGVTRSDVLAHMPRPPDASFVSKDVVRNDRWYFEGYRLVYSYRDGGELKSVSLVGEVPAAGASA